MNFTLRLFGQELFSIDFSAYRNDEQADSISLSDLGSIQLVSADESDEIEEEPEARRRTGF